MGLWAFMAWSTSDGTQWTQPSAIKQERKGQLTPLHPLTPASDGTQWTQPSDSQTRKEGPANTSPPPPPLSLHPLHLDKTSPPPLPPPSFPDKMESLPSPLTKQSLSLPTPPFTLL
ncbi:hypothetical protein ACOMHN_063708 [Nucella lapillus]